MTGRQVLGAVIAIVIATAVIPPGAACAINHRRVTRAEGDAQALAARLASGERVMTAGAILCGPGNVPAEAEPDGEPWIASPHQSTAAMLDPGERVPVDPWGNCYLVRASSGAPGRSRAITVLSAGPNGIVQTPFDAPAPRGDDIVVAR